jgi:hypothetical protein
VYVLLMFCIINTLQIVRYLKNKIFRLTENFNEKWEVGENKSQYLNCTIISQFIWGSIRIMKVMYEQRQQQLQQPIFSYVVCQLSSTPTDQKHVSSVRRVTNQCLTHICIISPILQKIVCNIRCIERIKFFK